MAPSSELCAFTRGTIRLLSTGPIQVDGNLPLTVGQPLEVMPVAEHDELLKICARVGIAGEEKWIEQARDLVEAWEAGELNDAGSAFRRLKAMLDEESRS